MKMKKVYLFVNPNHEIVFVKGNLNSLGSKIDNLITSHFYIGNLENWYFKYLYMAYINLLFTVRSITTS